MAISQENSSFFALVVIFTTLFFIPTLSLATTPQQITESATNELSPEIAINSQGDALIIWLSDEGGMTWSIDGLFSSYNQSKLLNFSQRIANMSDYPTVVYGGGRFLVGWISWINAGSNTTSIKKYIYVSSSTDGINWNGPILFAKSDVSHDYASLSLLFNGTQYLACWLDYFEITGRGMVDFLECSASRDGLSWSKPFFVRSLSRSVTEAKLVYAHGKYVLSWVEGRKCYIMAGNTLEGMSGGGTPVVENASTCFATYNGTTYIVVYSGYDEEIHYIYYDGGQWRGPFQITNSTANDDEPFLIYNGKYYYLVWRSDRSGSNNIYLMVDSRIPIEEPEVNIPVCGNGICESGENYETCSKDCLPGWKDPCANVTCPDKCEGTTYYSNGVCDHSTGNCIYTVIINNSDKCKTGEGATPKTPSSRKEVPSITNKTQINPCANVTCPDKCEGTTYYSNGVCDHSTGNCIYTVIINNANICMSSRTPQSMEEEEIRNTSKNENIQRCPDKCISTVFYGGGVYDKTTGSCFYSIIVKNSTKCAVKRKRTEEHVINVTYNASKICPEKCEGTTLYKGGVYDHSTNSCLYTQIINNAEKCIDLLKEKEKRWVLIVYPENGAKFKTQEVKVRIRCYGTGCKCYYSLNNMPNTTIENDTDVFVYGKDGKNSIMFYCYYPDGDLREAETTFYVEKAKMEVGGAKPSCNATRLVVINITSKHLWKDKLNRTYATITGVVYETGNKEALVPLAHAPLSIYDEVSMAHIADIETDATGKFEVSFRVPSYAEREGEFRVMISYAGDAVRKPASITERLSLSQAGAQPSYPEVSKEMQRLPTAHEKGAGNRIKWILLVVIILIGVTVVVWLVLKEKRKKESSGEKRGRQSGSGDESGGEHAPYYYPQPPQPYYTESRKIAVFFLIGLILSITVNIILTPTVVHAASCTDAGVKWVTARYGPIHPFTLSHGNLNQLYCTKFDKEFTHTETFNFRLNPSDPRCRGCCAYWCYILPGRDTCTRYRGWYANKIKEGSTKWMIRLIGTTEHADCCYGVARGAAVEGYLYINLNNWKVVGIPECGVRGGYKISTTGDEWIMHFGTSRPNNCGGCCCCPDGAGLSCDVLVEKRSDIRPPELVYFKGVPAWGWLKYPDSYKKGDAGKILYVRYGGRIGHPFNHNGLVNDYLYNIIYEYRLVDRISIFPRINHYDHVNYFFTTWLYVKKPGRWYFAIDGDDAVEVEIDGKVVASWYGGHPPCLCFYHHRPIYLSKGWHKLIVRHEEEGGWDGVRLYFIAPGDTSWRLFSVSNLRGRADVYAYIPPVSVMKTRSFIRYGLPERQNYWNYRKRITITTSTDRELENYPVKIVFDPSRLISAGKMRSDCADLRFTTLDGEKLKYYLESCTPTKVSVWVNIPIIPSGKNHKIDLYMYYGNPSATSESDISARFIFYDDFSRKDTTKWNWVRNWGVRNGYLINYANDWGSQNMPLVSSEFNANLSESPVMIEVRAKSGSNKWAYDISFHCWIGSHSFACPFLTESRYWYHFFDRHCDGWQCCCPSRYLRNWYTYKIYIDTNKQEIWQNNYRLDTRHVKLIQTDFHKFSLQFKSSYSYVDYVKIYKYYPGLSTSVSFGKEEYYSGYDGSLKGWSRSCTYNLEWLCRDNTELASTPYKLATYYGGKWHYTSWSTATSHKFTARPYDPVRFALECRDSSGNIGGWWYLPDTSYVRCDPNAPTTYLQKTKLSNGGYEINFVCSDAGGVGCSSTYYCKTTSSSCTPTTKYTGPFTITAQSGQVARWKVCYYSVDKLGNKENTKCTEILTTQDTQPPTLVKFNPTISAGWTKNCEFHLSWEYTDNIGLASQPYYFAIYHNGKWQYFGWRNNTFNSYTFVATPYDSVRFALKCKDINNNIGGWWYNPTNGYIRCDPYAPVTYMTQTKLSPSTIRINFTCTDHSIYASKCAATYYCKTTSSSCTPTTKYTGPFTITAQSGQVARWKVCYYSVDNAGNVETSKCGSVFIDDQAPTTIIKPNGTDWVNHDITVTLTCNDGSGSGCSKIYYKLIPASSSCPDPTTTTYYSQNSNTVTITIRGKDNEAHEYSICYYGVDNWGNVERVKKSKPFRIDKQNPVTQLQTDYDYIRAPWTNKNVALRFTCNDFNGSGCRYLEYYLGSEGESSKKTTTQNPFKLTITCPEGEACVEQIFYRSVDNAGNAESWKNITVKIDKKAPAGRVMIEPPILSTSSFMNVTLSCSDDESGCKFMEFTTNMSDKKCYTTENTYVCTLKTPTSCNGAGTYSYTLYLKDGAGNLWNIKGTFVVKKFTNCPCSSNDECYSGVCRIDTHTCAAIENIKSPPVNTAYGSEIRVSTDVKEMRVPIIIYNLNPVPDNITVCVQNPYEDKIEAFVMGLGVSSESKCRTFIINSASKHVVAILLKPYAEGTYTINITTKSQITGKSSQPTSLRVVVVPPKKGGEVGVKQPGISFTNIVVTALLGMVITLLR